jgi:hypothetical protein
MEKRARTPLNAPGPFFTEKDFCISCGAPEAEAPDLMAFDEERGSCYFRRQPETAEEIDRACRAVEVSCCDAVQYDGDDPHILQRLSRVNPTQYRAPRRWWQFWKST